MPTYMPKGKQTGDLFRAAAARDPALVPLAERMRPRTVDEVVGQQHILGPNTLLREAIETDQVPSLVFWGPPGTGKTTLARVIAAAASARCSSSTRSTASTRRSRTRSCRTWSAGPSP
jgi:putative ATPase